MLFLDEAAKQKKDDKKCPKCGKKPCICKGAKQSENECNESSIERELSRLNKFQEEFKMFTDLCHADIREMNMVHEGANEEEISAFKESSMKELNSKYPDLKEYLKNNF